MIPVQNYVTPHMDPSRRQFREELTDTLQGLVQAVNGLQRQDRAYFSPELLPKDPAYHFPRLIEETLGGVGGECCIPVGTVAWFADDSTPPDDWLICDGSAVDRSTYSDLHGYYENISYPFGNGDGSSTFNLPDLRGRVAGGANNANLPGGASGSLTTRNPGATTGAETHALVEAELPSHAHGLGSHTHTFTGDGHVHDLGSHTHSLGGSLHDHRVDTVSTTAGGSDSGLLYVSSAGENPGSLETTQVDVGGTNAATGDTGSGSSTGTTDAAGGDTDATGSGSAHENMQPTLFMVPCVYAGGSSSGSEPVHGISWGDWPGETSGVTSHSQGTRTYTPDGGESRTYRAVALGGSSSGYSVSAERALPPGFRGWNGPVAFRLLHGISGFTHGGTDLIVTLSVTDAAGNSLASKSVTYDATVNEDLDWIEIESRLLEGDFSRGDLFRFVLSASGGGAGNTWTHYVSALEARWA